MIEERKVPKVRGKISTATLNLYQPVQPVKGADFICTD
jgi:hypothetical protein